MQPDQMLASGDSIANALLLEYQVPMPNLGITDAEAEALIVFLGGAQASAPPAVVEQATEEQIVLGQDLFQGTKRLTNGGPTCNSCHDVTNDAVIGGGILARELTTVFSRLGGPGVRAILGSPPFPVMQRAYQDTPLTDEEVAALVGFLERADAEQALHQPRDYGIKLFGAGVVGVIMGWIKDIISPETRQWEEFYRNRFQHDRIVRSTHGVNCTGGCSWAIHVKDGIVTWETQQLDYPLLEDSLPPYEPRGCQRGISYSWYLYSPLRIKYPLIRSALLDAYRAKKRETGDPLKAWKALQADTAARRTYQQARGNRRQHQHRAGVRTGPGHRFQSDSGDVDAELRGWWALPPAVRWCQSQLLRLVL